MQRKGCAFGIYSSIKIFEICVVWDSTVKDIVLHSVSFSAILIW